MAGKLSEDELVKDDDEVDGDEGYCERERGISSGPD
jgi:hypothetical protein